MKKLTNDNMNIAGRGTWFNIDTIGFVCDVIFAENKNTKNIYKDIL